MSQKRGYFLFSKSSFAQRARLSVHETENKHSITRRSFGSSKTSAEEKRSTLIEHLIVLGLKIYVNKNEEIEIKQRKTLLTFLSTLDFS